MTKVLLINPGHLRDQYVVKFFPVGLASVASYLKAHGVDVHIWDIGRENPDIAEIRARIRSMSRDKYDHIGITGMIGNFNYIRRLAEELKRNLKAKISLGGPLASYYYEVVLKNTVLDFCVIGYGEKTYLDIVSGKPLKDIEGIAWNDCQIQVNQPGTDISYLDDLPLPAYELFDMEYYLNSSVMMRGIRGRYKSKRVMNLVTGWGCPFRCNFCSRSTNRIKTKSIDYIEKEIAFCTQNYRVDAIHFLDELLVLSKERILSFCNMIKKYRLEWDAQVRVDQLDKEILEAMYEAGCVSIALGIESASQKILDAMNKKITVDQIKETLNYCRETGILVKSFLIFGYPGENDQTVKETIVFFKSMIYPVDQVKVITPLPGTVLYDEAKLNGFIGEGPDSEISEISYLEWLSKHGGLLNRNFFYNRTEFSHSEFQKKFRYMQHKLNWNFIFAVMQHPFIVLKYRKVYIPYLRYWFKLRMAGLSRAIK
jgi:radical SAM superfamily enzyme YgiQ (UPF0313 family)